MPERPCSPHGWTLDTLEAHFSSRIDALEKMLNEREERNRERIVASDKALSAALNAADKAMLKAEMASEKRFEAVNEFRAQLADQATTLLPRGEYHAQHQALIDRVEALVARTGTFLPTVAFESQVKGILDRFEALNNLISANSARVSSIEASMRTRQEGAGQSTAIISIIIAALAAGGIISGFFVTLLRH